MKDNKKFIFSLVLIFSGLIGGGLFAIANSLQKIAEGIAHETAAANITCGTILFILLALALVGMIIMFTEIFKKNDK